jgi:hypothetical protein
MQYRNERTRGAQGTFGSEEDEFFAPVKTTLIGKKQISVPKSHTVCADGRLLIGKKQIGIPEHHVMCADGRLLIGKTKKINLQP